LRSCLFVLAILLALGVLAVLIPLGSALSLGQAVIVWLLLVSVLWTAHAAWGELGPLNVVVERGSEHWVFAGLPEADDVGAVLALDLSVEPPSVTSLTELPEDGPVTLRLTRARGRTIQLEFRKGENVLWKPPPVRVGARVELPESVLFFSRLNPRNDGVTLRFLDR
jgi:hypothetical protein